MDTDTKNRLITPIMVTGVLWGLSIQTSPLPNQVPNQVIEKPDDLDLLARSLKLLAPEERVTKLTKNPQSTRDSREIYLEQKIHELINQERINNRLKPLNWHDLLAAAAHNHSIDMAAAGKCEHVLVPGHDFFWRYKQVGFTGYVQIGLIRHMGAENIYSFGTTGKIGPHGTTLDQIAHIVVDGWMASKGHKKNILTDYWGREGIGVAITFTPTTKWTRVYVTENFC